MLHINRPSSTRYVARVRQAGHRKWTVVGDSYQTQGEAVLGLAERFRYTMWKRGEVLITADCYDPTVIVKMSR